MLTLKQILGIVSLLAVVMASVAATLRPPNSTTELAGGLLFTLTIALCVVGSSRLISAFPTVDRFWAGFLVACAICLVISFSDRLMSANTAPEHVTRVLLKLSPADASVSVHRSNERFYALQGIVTNATVLVFATGCGLFAQRRQRGPRTELRRDG